MASRNKAILIMFCTFMWLLVVGTTQAGKIHDAAKDGDLVQIESLLNANPKMITKEDDNGLAPLHLAVQENHKEIVELLLCRGANVNEMDRTGWTPLHHASCKGNKDVAELLLSRGADVNAGIPCGCMTPLHLAAQSGHKEVAELLLSRGADVNLGDNYTPLHAAATADNKEIVELLLSKGADVNAKVGIYTPLRCARSEEVADLLRRYGAVK